MPATEVTNAATPRELLPIVFGVGWTTLRTGLLGSVLMWAALPPVAGYHLAWIAPVPWLFLIRMTRLEGKRPYASLWLAGFAFWMGTLHWLRLPHWLTSFGWVILSSYLACYLPAFVWLARTSVHRLSIPLIIVAPVIWTSLEYARAHLFTGFTMSSLGHTQYLVLPLIQISDVVGFYGVSFLVMFVAACLTRIAPVGDQPIAWRLALPPVVAVLLAWSYGAWRIDAAPALPGPKVALIQGNFDAQFDGKDRREEVFNEYMRLTRSVLREDDQLDLIVWPESTFPVPLVTLESGPAAEDVGEGRLRMSREEAEDWKHEAMNTFSDVARAQDTPIIVNSARLELGDDFANKYNTATFVTAQGVIADWYDKMHLVMFGEYIPLGTYMPWLYRPPFPLSSGLTPGDQPKAFSVGPWRAAISICFETILPHVVRRQVAALQQDDQSIDMLVNVTNDGWFWGSSELDLHLICGVFRAVECRKPLLVAANTGFSAHIDGNGRILAQGPRHDVGTIVADVKLDGRASPYVRYGDWFAILCAVATAAATIAAYRKR